jgi:hypothetical protein
MVHLSKSENKSVQGDDTRAKALELSRIPELITLKLLLDCLQDFQQDLL